MNILAFDTCLGAVSVAVRRRDAGGLWLTHHAREVRERGHAERLLPMMAEVMAEAGLAFPDIGRIAVTVGPGTFTGVRVGVAAARGLALASGIATVGATSLAVMAHQAGELLGKTLGDRALAVAVDARRGSVYLQITTGADPAGPPQLLVADDAARQIGMRPVLIVGSGADAGGGCREGSRRTSGDSTRRPATRCAIARLARLRSRLRSPLAAPLPQATRREAPGRSLLAAGHPMSGATDYRHVSILWASPEHAAELARLHAGLFEKAWDADSFLRLLGHPGATSFLARIGTPPQTVGFILGQLAADEAEILTLGVRKDSQRHGIARRLVGALARAAKNAEARRLFLEVGQSNTAALALYKGFGFQEIARRKGYYEHAGAPAEDALVLALSL